jgi:hypothetical protein
MQFLLPQGYVPIHPTSLRHSGIFRGSTDIALAGLILWVGKQKRPENRLEPLELAEVFKKYESNIDEIVNTVLHLYELFQADSEALAKEQKKNLMGRALIFFKFL